MALADLALRGQTTLLALARRRLSLAVLVLLPLAFYAATHDSVGRSVRALVFGITWAVSTVTFFATVSARDLEPRLRLAGRSRAFLATARIGALALASLLLTAAFWLLVVADQPVRSPAAVALAFVVTALVAVAFGTAVGSIITSELEGTLVLFLFAGLQAVTNPFDGYTRLLPFWSSRELGTYAIDGPAQGSLAAGLGHAAVVVTVCALIVAALGRRRG